MIINLTGEYIKNRINDFVIPSKKRKKVANKSYQTEEYWSLDPQRRTEIDEVQSMTKNKRALFFVNLICEKNYSCQMIADKYFYSISLVLKNLHNNLPSEDSPAYAKVKNELEKSKPSRKKYDTDYRNSIYMALDDEAKAKVDFVQALSREDRILFFKKLIEEEGYTPAQISREFIFKRSTVYECLREGGQKEPIASKKATFELKHHDIFSKKENSTLKTDYKNQYYYSLDVDKQTQIDEIHNLSDQKRVEFFAKIIIEEGVSEEDIITLFIYTVDDIREDLELLAKLDFNTYLEVYNKLHPMHILISDSKGY